MEHFYNSGSFKLATKVNPIGNRQPDSRWDVIYDCGDAFLIGECKKIEALVSRSPSKYGFQNGRYLEELSGRVIYLSDLNEQFEAYYRNASHDDPFIEPAGPNPWEGATQVVPPFFAVIPSAPQPMPDETSVREAARFIWIVCALMIGRLRKLVSAKIQEVKVILYEGVTTFCGVSWSRRTWFLIHGSHPPKPEYCL